MGDERIHLGLAATRGLWQDKLGTFQIKTRNDPAIVVLVLVNGTVLNAQHRRHRPALYKNMNHNITFMFTSLLVPHSLGRERAKR